MTSVAASAHTSWTGYLKAERKDTEMARKTRITLHLEAVDGDDGPQVTGHGTITYDEPNTVDGWTPSDSEDVVIRVRAVKQVNDRVLELVVLDVTESGPSYVKLTETNDWEGEQWAFYIPLTGNEDAIRELAAGITAKTDPDDGDEAPYALDLTPIPGTTVDLLVAHANDDEGYMAAHTKLAGRLVVGGVDLATIRDEDDVLYKGGIKNLMKEKED